MDPFLQVNEKTMILQLELILIRPMFSRVFSCPRSSNPAVWPWDEQKNGFALGVHVQLDWPDCFVVCYRRLSLSSRGYKLKHRHLG